MAIPPQLSEETLRRVGATRESAATDLGAIIENARWLATLVMAEIAGIAAYRKLVDERTLSVSFALVVCVLALSLAALIATVITARQERSAVSDRLQGVVVRMYEISSDNAIAPAPGGQTVEQLREKTISSLPSALRWPVRLEATGLILLGLASILAAFILFLTEFTALLRSLFGLQ